MITTKHLPLVTMHNRHDLTAPLRRHACRDAPAFLIHHLVSLPRGVTLDAERPFVRRDAEHRDEDASGSSPLVALCIHRSSSEGDVMNAFHGSFLLGEDR